MTEEEKEANRLRAKLWYAANRDTKYRDYRIKNADRRAETMKKWRLENRERLKLYQKAYNTENTEKIQEQRRAYSEANREKMKEAKKQWLLRNPEYYQLNYAKNSSLFRERRKKYYAKNIEKCREYSRNYYATNREKLISEANKRVRARYWKDVESSRAKARRAAGASYETPERKEYLREYAKRNIGKVREWKRANRKNSAQKRLEYARKYRAANAEKVRAKERIYSTKRYMTDTQFKLKCLLSGRISQVIRNAKIRKSQRTHKLLGASIVVVMEYLESQFKEGMTWKNHALDGWHIDHIIPIAAFDLTDPEQQHRCFNYKNLQPLWWWENLTKNDKLIA